MFCDRDSVNFKEEYDNFFTKTDRNTGNTPLWKITVNLNGDSFVTPTDEYFRLAKIESALEKAHDIRKFEIERYWQRTAYFWAFIVSIYIAYYHVLKEICCSHGELPLVALAGLAVFFSYSWYLSSRGSHKWQKNWERHVDLLEDEMTGPLYKTFLDDTAPSVNKINEFAGIIMTLCAGVLFFYELLERLDVVFASLAMAIFALLLFVYKRHTIGNADKQERCDFTQRVYS